jgi:excisionase family DNA binding protein
MSVNVFDPPELLTADQAAEYLGIRPQTLAVWRITKRYPLPYLKVGARAKYRREDLDRFLAERTVGGPAE